MRMRPAKPSALVLVFLLFVVPPLHAQTPIPAEVLAEIPGTVIVGGGKGGEAVRSRLVETAGGAKAKLVILFDGDEKEEQRLVEAWGKYTTAAVEVQAIRDRKQADDPDVAKKIAAATGVWIEPGDATKLAANLTGTAVERELRKLLERGGVLGGESSSATLFGKTTPTGETGLALLPNAIVETHLLKRNRIDRLLAALAKQPGLVGLGIDEETVVVVKGRRLKVSGDSYAAVCLNPSTKRAASVQLLKDKGEADLLALQRAAFLRTQPPYPPEKPASPEVPKGTLVIGGGGGMPQEIVKRFIELAGGPDALIVVIPTAMDDPLPKEIGEVRMLKRAGATNVKTLHTRKRSEANSPEFTAVLKEAKGVWFSGGRQWKFVDSYQDTLAEKLFHEVLKRGGVIGGSSAGASIQSEYMPRGHPLGNTVMMAEGYEHGLGFLPGVAVDQHFFKRNRTKDMTALMATYPQLLGIGIDEGTVVIVQGTVMEVAGKSKVAVYDRRKQTDGDKDYEELFPGDKYDMKKREKVK